MKVYSLPKEVPAPEVDYANYNRDKEAAKETKHLADLRAWLRKAGYTGKHSGKIVEFGVADGYASYMLAEGRRSFLIHLPYGDAYSYREAEFLPKAEIIRRIAASDKFRKLFKAR